MEEICPHTGRVCPVMVNLETMDEAIGATAEFLAFSSLRLTIERFLRNGECNGSTHQLDGDFTYCANVQLPEVALALDSTRNDFSGDASLFEIENIGKIRGF